jgi:hypothetical protein
MQPHPGVTKRDLQRVYRSLNGGFMFYIDVLCRFERRACRFPAA